MVFTMCMAFAPVGSIAAEGDLVAGDLIKSPVSSAVYYYDGTNRLAFPNSAVFFSWYEDFDGVITITAEELAAINYDGLLVTMKPGTMLVKIESDPKVYAVEAGGVLRWVDSEATAVALYGADWASKIVDVSDAFWFWYDKTDAVDNKVMATAHPAGTLFSYTDSDDIYYVDANGEKRMVTEDGFTANNFSADYVITGVADTITYTTGTSVTEMEAGLFPITSGTVTTPPVEIGELGVAISAMTPAAGTIPHNVQGFVYTKLVLSAGNEAVDLTGLTIERDGLGSYANFDTVYVEVDGIRHGTKRTLGSDDEVEINFATSYNKITILANQSVTIDIVADMAGDTDYAGHYNVLAVTALTTTADLTASLPIVGNPFTISSIGVATADITFNGSDAEVELGDNQVEVGAMKVANSSSAEDFSFESVVLENTGSADNVEVINYTLYDESDTVVAGPVNANSSDYISFTLNEAFLITYGHSEDFVIKADISDGRGEDIILDLEEITDFNATGLANGYPVTATGGGANLDTYDIIGGAFVIDEADTNPSSQDVAPGDEDITFLIADLEAAEETVVVKSLSLTCNDGNSLACADVENITLYLDDVVVGGPSDGTDPIVFGDDFEVDGTQTLVITADIGDNASGTYSMSFDYDAVTVETLDGTAISTRKSGSATGNSVVVGTSASTLSVDGTYGSRNMVAGDDDFLIGRFILEASDYEGISISSYKPHLTLGDDSGLLAEIEELWISEDDDIVTSVTATSTFNVSQELAASGTKTISVYVTVDSNYTATGTPTIIVDEMAVETEGLVSEDENTVYLTGTGPTITVAAGDLALTLGANTTNAATVLGGASYEVGEYNFEATNVGYTITEVTIEAHNGSNVTNTSAVVSAELGGVAAIAVNGVLTFDSDYYVEADEDIDLDLTVLFNGDFNSVTSGDAVEFAVVGYKYISDNDTGEETSTDYISTAQLMHVRKTDVLVTSAANDTTLGATTNLMDVTFTADAAGDVTISTASFSFNFHDDATVIGQSLTISNVRLINENDDTVGTAYSTPFDADTDSSDVVITLAALNEEIGAGSSETFTLEITVSGYATDDYINVKMLDDTGATSTYFGWLDGEATSDISGWYVEGIDSPSYEATR